MIIAIATDTVPEERVALRQPAKERAEISLLCSGRLYDIVPIVVVSVLLMVLVYEECQGVLMRNNSRVHLEKLRVITKFSAHFRDSCRVLLEWESTLIPPGQSPR